MVFNWEDLSLVTSEASMKLRIRLNMANLFCTCNLKEESDSSDVGSLILLVNVFPAPSLLLTLEVSIFDVFVLQIASQPAADH